MTFDLQAGENGAEIPKLDEAAEKLIANESEIATNKQKRASIPVKEDYFMPEDERGEITELLDENQDEDIVSEEEEDEDSEEELESDSEEASSKSDESDPELDEREDHKLQDKSRSGLQDRETRKVCFLSKLMASIGRFLWNTC